VHTTGGASGTIGFDIIDPTKIKNGHEYEITFKDTTYKIENKNVVKTLSFSLKNLTENSFLFEDDKRIELGDEISLTDGFRLWLDNVEQISLNKSKTGWNNPDVYSFDFETFTYLIIKGVENPSDYKIVFGDVGIATSKILPLAAVHSLQSQ